MMKEQNKRRPCFIVICDKFLFTLPGGDSKDFVIKYAKQNIDSVFKCGTVKEWKEKLNELMKGECPVLLDAALNIIQIKEPEFIEKCEDIGRYIRFTNKSAMFTYLRDYRVMKGQIVPFDRNERDIFI